MAMKWELVIFDFDGPIVNLQEAKSKTMELLNTKLRLGMSEIEKNMLLVGIERAYKNFRLFDYKEILEVVLKQMADSGYLKVEQRQIDNFSKMFGGLVEKEIKIDSEVIGPMNRLRVRGVKACFYSSQESSYVRKYLRQIPELNRIKVFGRDYFKESKPSILNLLMICQEYSLSPNKVIMVGDNVAVDLLPAKLLGMETILISQHVDLFTSNCSFLEDLLFK